jgi:hypothetical protein
MNYTAGILLIVVLCIIFIIILIVNIRPRHHFNYLDVRLELSAVTWIYINLAHRVDRRIHIETELRAAGIEDRDIIRLDAILHEDGAIGCGLSHIKALELAMSIVETTYVVIVEDDFTWRNAKTALQTIQNAIGVGFDVFTCAYGPPLSFDRSKAFSYGDYEIIRITKFQTASCYIVHSPYIPRLLENMKVAVYGLNNGKPKNCFAIDKYWQHLQKIDDFKTTLPQSLGTQCPFHSDIEKKFVFTN